MTRRWRRLAAGGLVAAALLTAHGANARLESATTAGPAGHLLYLPSGRLLRVLSLGHPESLADLIYLWSIQYYGHYQDEVRFDYVQQVYDRVITDLDPRFRDAYILGAMILTMEARRPEEGLALLEKGAAANPTDWMLAFEAGFTAYHPLRQYDRAAEHFRRAMDAPGAPLVIRRFHAAMFERMGDPRTALKLWAEVLQGAQSDYVRSVARRHVEDLTREIYLDDLGLAVRLYRSRTGAPPPDLRTLVRAGILTAVPLDPDGRPFVYDPVTGEVAAPAQGGAVTAAALPLVAASILLGLLVGSFLNVCIHRLPRGESVVHPRSACPRCRGMLRWHDNVPLLSYLWLSARCRRCAAPIAPAYPLVEAATGALFGALVLRFGPRPEALVWAGFCAAVVVLVLIDARHHILPNAITLPGLALGLAASFAAPGITPVQSVAGAALGWTVPWSIGAGYRLVRGREGMGMGDLKMLAMVGAFVGWKGVLFTIGAGSLLGAITGVPWALARGQGMQAALPFGTFLGIAAIAEVFGARPLLLGWLGIAG